MDAESLTRSVRDFLAESPDAAVIENGVTLFDLSTSRYSISSERGKCLLHFWSTERNIVRRVVDTESKRDVLRLSVIRLGQARPVKLDICRGCDRRSPSAKKSARSVYQARLERALARRFPDFKLLHFSTTMDLERSFGPIYTRGLLRKGQTAFAVLGVNEQETQASIDGSLTCGMLWLDVCRQTCSSRMVVEGLKLFVPAGHSSLVRERIALLDHNAAKWQLHQFDEREDSIVEVDCSDRGNIATHLVHCPDESATKERFRQSITRISQLIPEAEVAVLSSAEIAFRLFGLEFARARIAHDPDSYRSTTEIVFGPGREEHILTDTNSTAFLNLIQQVAQVRHSTGPRDHPLFRLHPERWLESLVIHDVTALDERLDASCVYSQVPAFSAADRAMIDVLTTTLQGRLAVLELKADEDLHLPLQGLDYWSRVQWHHARGEFHHFGYFPGRELSPERPLLFFVAPALHVHPSTDTLLHYLSPAIDWTLVGIDERWREGVRPVFFKRPESLHACASGR
ncbi:MAG TPA: hypothetical protein VFI95_01095 [Terriglobales bacterium]|nr:hypothetical protein [Terriglobales bacterium]